MISKLNCLFCQQELIREGMNHWWCSCNLNHQGKELYGTTELWQALIQAKQNLEIAQKALKEYANKDNWGCIEDDRDRFIHTYWYFDACDDGGWVNAQKALEQIEHKE